mgnify:CR=1 FL=1
MCLAACCRRSTSLRRNRVRADEARFTDAASFAADPNLLIGSQAGVTPFYVAVYDVLDGDEQNPRIKLFETIGAAIQAMRAGDVDLVLADSTGAEGYVRANPEALEYFRDRKVWLLEVNDPVGGESLGPYGRSVGDRSP